MDSKFGRLAVVAPWLFFLHKYMYKWLHFVANYSIIIHALITRAHSVVIIIIFKKIIIIISKL